MQYLQLLAWSISGQLLWSTLQSKDQKDCDKKIYNLCAVDK